MVVFFDNGPYGDIFQSREDKELNPAHEDNYAPPTGAKDPHTYTFTNADYDAAVARGPMKEVQK